VSPESISQTIGFVFALGAGVFAYRRAMENRWSAAAVAFVVVLIGAYVLLHLDAQGTGDGCYWVDGGKHADFQVCDGEVYP
jgi:hypothetical protein